MSNELQVFSFESQEIRTVIGDDGGTWWVAIDVCRSIGVVNYRDALGRVDLEDKGVGIADTRVGSADNGTGKQILATVNESGLYALILASRKPEAKRFKRWLTSEVIPSIRKTGRYVVPGAIQPTGDPVLMSLEIIRDIRMGQIATAEKVAALEDRTAAVEARVDAVLSGDVEEVSFMSVKGYCRIHGLKFSKGEESKIGARLTRHCKEQGVEVGSKPDETWGKVNIYPMAMLDEWRAGLMQLASVGEKHTQAMEAEVPAAFIEAEVRKMKVAVLEDAMKRGLIDEDGKLHKFAYVEEIDPTTGLLVKGYRQVSVA